MPQTMDLLQKALVVKNAAAMSKAFMDRGYQVISGGTENHSMLIDLRSNSGGLLNQAVDVLDQLFRRFSDTMRLPQLDATTTQEKAWMLLATQAMADRGGRINVDAEQIAGRIEAHSRDAALSALTRQGHFPIDAVERGAGATSSGTVRILKLGWTTINDGEVAMIATMVKSRSAS